MPRVTRSSKSIQKASLRASRIASIAPNLDLGNGHTIVVYQGKITDAQAKLDEYNAALASADKLSDELVALEKALDIESEAMLNGIGFKYGKDSMEYEQAGGVRKSERKKPTRKPKS